MEESCSKFECYSVYAYSTRQGNKLRQEDSDSPRFLRYTRKDQSCRSLTLMNYDGKRNQYREVSDAVNQQQKSCFECWKRVRNLVWLGRFYWELCAAFQQDLKAGRVIARSGCCLVMLNR